MKRGRPNEQLRKCTVEGLVWQVVCKFTRANDTTLTVKMLREMTGCSAGAIVKTLAWQGYSKMTGRKKPPRGRKPPQN